MYISQIRLRPDADPTRLAQQFDNSTTYREHQLIWQLFPHDPNASRDFLFRAEQKNGVQHYLLLSKRQPVPDAAIWQIETKEYRPQLHSGQRLAFQLRANPVVTRKNSHGKSSRHDIIMDAKKRTDWQNTPINQRPHLPELIQQEGENWLSERLSRHGAHMESVRVDGYQLQSSQKKSGNKPIQHSSLDFEGMLQVTDPMIFTQLLNTGLGPAKAFGFGLLLVRRI
ncbi:MAG: type I-E CRISPR-associated protein Cas6/Cse3/CasE [Sedimenticola sp.]